jgi:hypothetical protein
MNVALTRSDSPEFADAARVQGFVGVLSVPLAPRVQHLGALNLYSRTQAESEPAAEETAQLFADQTSVVLANAEPFGAVDRLNAQLWGRWHPGCDSAGPKASSWPAIAAAPNRRLGRCGT